MHEDNRYVVLTSKCFNSNDPQLMVRNGNGVSAFGLKKYCFLISIMLHLSRCLITAARYQYSYFFIHRRSDLRCRKIEWLIKTFLSFGSKKDFIVTKELTCLAAYLQNAIMLPLLKFHRRWWFYFFLLVHEALQ